MTVDEIIEQIHGTHRTRYAIEQMLLKLANREVIEDFLVVPEDSQLVCYFAMTPTLYFHTNVSL